MAKRKRRSLDARFKAEAVRLCKVGNRGSPYGSDDYRDALEPDGIVAWARTSSPPAADCSSRLSPRLNGYSGRRTAAAAAARTALADRNALGLRVLVLAARTETALLIVGASFAGPGSAKALDARLRQHLTLSTA